MIECKIDKGKLAVKAEGTALVITTECSMLIRALYRNLESRDGSNATREIFRTSLAHFLTDPDSTIFEAEEAEGEGEGDDD